MVKWALNDVIGVGNVGYFFFYVLCTKWQPTWAKRKKINNTWLEVRCFCLQSYISRILIKRERSHPSNSCSVEVSWDKRTTKENTENLSEINTKFLRTRFVLSFFAMPLISSCLLWVFSRFCAHKKQKKWWLITVSGREGIVCTQALCLC